MNTILVWVLVTVGGYGGDQVVYSPPMPDIQTCEFLRKSVVETKRIEFNGRRAIEFQSRCVQIRMVVIK